MSRSVRRPYAAITGVLSAKDDKRRAHRGERRAQKQALCNVQDYDALLMPHRLECAWNDVWNWRRDGKQTLMDLPARQRQANVWYHYELAGWKLYGEPFEKWYADQVRDVERLRRK